MPSNNAAEAGQPVLDQLVDGHRLEIGSERPGLDAAEVEQVRHQPVQPLGLIVHQLEQLVSRMLVGDDAVAQV